jgi:hypothetical protein
MNSSTSNLLVLSAIVREWLNQHMCILMALAPCVSQIAYVLVYKLTPQLLLSVPI